MNNRQKQTVEAFRRVSAFIAAHPLPSPQTYGEPVALLEDVVEQLTSHSNLQETSKRLRKAQTQNLQTAKAALRDLSLRPISQIARAALRGSPGADRATKLPVAFAPVEHLLAIAAAFRSVGETYQDVMLKNGRPADFLTVLDDAVMRVQQAAAASVSVERTKVGASGALAAELKRGRDAVEMLDATVTTAFAGSASVLDEWRNARRIRAYPVRSSTEPQAAPVAPAAPAEAAASATAKAA
ncbi:MAG TPA: hypothetical protein VJ867_00250 [Gemmatimonadaceae bacterium]|nr:hypothetical protein [Gemmatimonadaceae bacterium]